MLKREVAIVQTIAVAAVIMTVLMLFLNEPTAPPAPAAEADIPAGVDAAALYGDRCAGCHGGDGSGGVGPPVRTERVLERFPDVADQIAVVTEGRGGMPAFEGRLDPEEIAAVVEYTRTSLG